MEAVALYDFQKTSDDEITFSKGSILKVIQWAAECVCVFVCMREWVCVNTLQNSYYPVILECVGYYIILYLHVYM